MAQHGRCDPQPQRSASDRLTRATSHHLSLAGAPREGYVALFELGAAVFEFVRHLVDTTGFPPRWICGDWSPFLGWLHILSDLAIWSAYTAIPCILAYFVRRRRNVSFSRIYWLFGAFMMVCAATDLLEAIIFWFPLYRLAARRQADHGRGLLGHTVVALVPDHSQGALRRRR